MAVHLGCYDTLEVAITNERLARTYCASDRLGIIFCQVGDTATVVRRRLDLPQCGYRPPDWRP